MNNSSNELDPIHAKINELISFAGADPSTFESDLAHQIIETAIKLVREHVDTGELKLMTRSLKEMRYAFSVFDKFPVSKRVAIFGSARTPEKHPDYIAAKTFAEAMAKEGWACLTGGAEGIMQAGIEGAQKQASFGLSIRLPSEAPTQSLLHGDPKLIVFRYFFTRKLMFLSHANAIAAFPGGFGTMDELFEALTLMQTGKSNIIPIVLMEGPDSNYWSEWLAYVKQQLFQSGWTSAEDFRFFALFKDTQKAVDHILHFYRRYHSSRYVKDTFVIRMKTPLSDSQLAQLNEEFSILLAEGKFYLTDPLSDEEDHLNLPRLAFKHNHSHLGTLRALIDRINDLE